MKRLEALLASTQRVPGESEEHYRLRVGDLRIIGLLKALRTMWVALFLVVVVAGVAVTMAFVSLRADVAVSVQEQRTNRIVICDLYRQLEVPSPPAIDCVRLLADPG